MFGLPVPTIRGMVTTIRTLQLCAAPQESF